MNIFPGQRLGLCNSVSTWAVITTEQIPTGTSCLQSRQCIVPSVFHQLFYKVCATKSTGWTAYCTCTIWSSVKKHTDTCTCRLHHQIEQIQLANSTICSIRHFKIHNPWGLCHAWHVYVYNVCTLQCIEPNCDSLFCKLKMHWLVMRTLNIRGLSKFSNKNNKPTKIYGTSRINSTYGADA